jgi:hypothetical protein
MADPPFQDIITSVDLLSFQKKSFCFQMYGVQVSDGKGFEHAVIFAPNLYPTMMERARIFAVAFAQLEDAITCGPPALEQLKHLSDGHRQCLRIKEKASPPALLALYQAAFAKLVQYFGKVVCRDPGLRCYFFSLQPFTLIIYEEAENPQSVLSGLGYHALIPTNHINA